MRLIYVAYRAQPDDSPTGAFNSGSGATLIRESRRRISTLFGFLAVCCAVALARGVPGAQTTAGRVTAAAVFGGLLVLLIVGWIVMVRRPRTWRSPRTPSGTCSATARCPPCRAGTEMSCAGSSSFAAGSGGGG